MRQRQVQIDPALGGGAFGGAVEPERRLRIAATLHLDLVQSEPTQAQSLESRLLGCEPRGQMRPRPRTGVGGVELALGEESLGERGPALERALDPLDLDQVDAGAACQSASRST